MGIVYQKDKRSGITYAYENQSFWDSELKRSRSKRKLIGRVDPDTGKIVPTDGRGKRRSPSYVPSEDDYVLPKTMKERGDEIKKLRAEIASLKAEIENLKSAQEGK